MIERDVERRLVRRVRELGGEVRKVRWVGRNGAPDRVVFLTGKPALWVELKRPGGRLRRCQVREHERMRNAGQHVVVWSSIDEIEEGLSQWNSGLGSTRN